MYGPWPVGSTTMFRSQEEYLAAVMASMTTTTVVEQTYTVNGVVYNTKAEADAAQERYLKSQRQSAKQSSFSGTINGIIYNDKDQYDAEVARLSNGGTVGEYTTVVGGEFRGTIGDKTFTDRASYDNYLATM